MYKGKYCNSSTVFPYECPMGHYCPSGTQFSTQYKCPPGTYNSNMSSISVTACELCPPSMYCEGYGNVLPSGLCSEGYYCRSGAMSATPGNTGYLNASSLDGKNASCYKTFDCICPDLNETRGKQSTSYIIVIYVS